jgi:NADPH2:quinone reductase
VRAITCTDLGGPEKLSVPDTESPEPGPGQVVIDVAFASLNFPDLLTIQGLYQVKAEPPFVPGFEASGIVSALGADVTGISVGDRVSAYNTIGAFAEQWVVDAKACVPVPPGVPLDVAASINIAYGTSYHALKQRAQLRKGETLLVLGAAGGVGSVAVEIGSHLGAHVIAAASSEDKLKFCRELGATETINYATEDIRARIKEITGGRGVDVVYDPVGGEISELAFRSIAWRGRHLVIGFASGDIPALPWNLSLLKGASVVGVFWGSFAAHEPEVNAQNMKEMFNLVLDGELTPQVTQSFGLDEYEAAYGVFASRSVQGKVVFAVNP